MSWPGRDDRTSPAAGRPDRLGGHDHRHCTSGAAPLPRPRRQPAVDLAAVTKDFGSVHAVRGVDLRLEQGEVVAFLGPNGAGKTSTIDMVLGLSRPTSGRVQVLGHEPRHAVAHGLVAAVMQTGGLLKDLTVRDTVRYTASLFADTAPVDEVLEVSGIAADRRPQGRQVLRRRAAAAAVRDGAAARPRAPGARRADHRHGRRGSPLVLGGDPARRRPRQDRAVRHPLPRRGRPVRRPRRAAQPRPGRGRRHRAARSRR